MFRIGFAFLFSLVILAGHPAWATRSPVCDSSAAGFADVKQTASQLSDLSRISPFGKPVKLAAVYGPDDRVAIRDGSYPSSAIGKIMRPDGGYCTAVMISPCHAMTAKHCFFDPPTPVVNTPFVTSQGLNHKVIDSFALPGGKWEDDWIALELDGNPGSQGRGQVGPAGFMRISNDTPESLRGRKDCNTMGYNSDVSQGKVVSNDPNTEFRGHYNESLRGYFGPNYANVRADAHVGVSGGPVWCWNENNEAVLVGLVSQIEKKAGTKAEQVHVPDSYEKGNGVVTSSAFAKQVNAWMETHKCNLKSGK